MSSPAAPVPTSASDPGAPTSPAEDPATSTSPPPEEPTSETPSPTESPTETPTETPTEPETTSTSTSEEPTTSSETPTSSSSETTSSTSTTTSEESTSTTPTPTTSETTSEPETTTEPPPTTEVFTSTDAGSTQTDIVTFTRTRDAPTDEPSSTSTLVADPTPINPGGGNGGGLDSGAKIAIGVAVPIGAIVILAIVGLFWWKKRKARQQAEEERRKEVEDYSYNPNADPTVPNVGPDGGYEMREDTSGYRGWGTTLAGSTGRKASTTMSGGGMTYSDPASPKQGHESLSRSDDAYAPEGEILGAMGPAAANNRNAQAGVNRGASNASSSYSAANQSDNSEGAGSYANAGAYYDQSAQNPYVDYSGAQELPAQPVIRDNPARRNTRIENPSHYPQQSAGISQNF